MFQPHVAKGESSSWELFASGHKLWLVFALLTAIMSALGSYVIYTVKKNAEQHLIAHLEQILEGTSMMVANSYENLIQNAFSNQKNMALRKLARELAVAHGEDLAEKREAFRRLTEDLNRYPENLGFIVTNGSGEPLIWNVGSVRLNPSALTFEGAVEQDVSISQPLLLEKIQGEKEGQLVVAVRYPLEVPARADSIFMWKIYDARQIFRSLLQPGRSGTTGEIYGFNRKGLMISDSRFNEHLYRIKLLNPGEEASMRVSLRDPGVDLTSNHQPLLPRDRWPLTRMAEAATRGGHGSDISSYRDYRGVPVVGTWTWFERYGFGIAHEIDQQEAFFNLRMLIELVTILLGLLLATTLISGFLSWRMRLAEEQKLSSQERLTSLQNDLAHYSRLSTMGEMATGLAHEINQPLVAISNYARALILEAEKQGSLHPERLRNRLNQIEVSALRAGEIIQRLRHFVSPGKNQSAPVAVLPCIKDALSLLAVEIERLPVTVQINPAEDLPRVRVDEVQLQQVIVNLVRNSIEAMQSLPDRTHRLVIDMSCDPEQRVVIAVKDTGPGFDQAIKGQMFEPFTSSKSKGMGMGLAISRTIMESHGGKIELSEDSQHGATFKLYLPACKERELTDAARAG